MTILTQESFEALMEPFCLTLDSQIGVGVSGGADSLCLMWLLSKWVKKHSVRLTALTVNHNLRAEAEQEAQMVQAYAQQWGIKHVILKNEMPIPQTGLEEYARMVRYRLLTDFCHEQKIDTLFLAHHAGDQAETFLLRLSKKSGLTGLKSMTPETKVNGIRVCRPFLKVSKAVLAETLSEQGISWAEDKMNQDTHYTRVKFRKFLPKLQSVGITTEVIGVVAERLARADTALETWTDFVIRQFVWIDFRGFARIPFSVFEKYPQEVKIRVLQKVITTIGQGQKPVSLQSVEALCAKLPCYATLGECVLVPHKTGLYVAKEGKYQAKAQKLQSNVPTRWDRFLITAKEPCLVRAGSPERKIENIPSIVQKTFPAVFIQKELEKEIQIDYKMKNDPLVQIRFLTQADF